MAGIAVGSGARRAVVVVATAALIAAAALTSGVTGAAVADIDRAVLSAEGPTVSVIVQTDGTPAERAVERIGGRVTRALPIVDGFAADVPAARAAELASIRGIRVVTLNRTMRLNGGGPGSPSPHSAYRKAVNADKLHNAGITGGGVTVALIDTGIADVPDLAGRVLPVTDDLTGATSPCVNLSGEPGCNDSYGHGTFLAGIIAGDGAASNGAWTGMAPDANLVSLKLAGADGASDVSSVLAALQWVVSFKNDYGIRVVNLSLGTDGTQTWRTDPLNYAVERAWDAGIVVVVSASNRGPDAGTIAKPGDDPLVITVGAVDDNGTRSLNDDAVPHFSSRGPTAADGLAKPDVAAPGGHIVSLRAPGSALDANFPAFIDAWYRKGSGTSMSAALVSGAAALMISADPAIVPDRVKHALVSTARPAASSDPMAVGAGVVDAQAAALSAPPGLANQGVAERSSGLGSLDASRGTVRVQASDPAGTVVQGALTAQLLLWQPLDYTGIARTGASWYGASWYGASWYGASWYGNTWEGASWYGASWYGASWYGASWYGASWYGASWYGAWE